MPDLRLPELGQNLKMISSSSYYDFVPGTGTRLDALNM